MKIKQLLKEQEREFDEVIKSNVCSIPDCDKKEIKQFIHKSQNKLIKSILDEVNFIGVLEARSEKKMNRKEFDAYAEGWNERVRLEKAKAEEILKELNL